MVEPTTPEEFKAKYEELKKALRWGIAYLINSTKGVEDTVGPRANVAQIRQGIKEGIKRAGVPRGALTDLAEVEKVLKEWDYKTFRVEQEAILLNQAPEGVNFKLPRCPKMLLSWIEYCNFFFELIDMDQYRNAMKSPMYHFICIPHQLCRYELITQLSNGKFVLEEKYNTGDTSKEEGVCGFIVKPKL